MKIRCLFFAIPEIKQDAIERVEKAIKDAKDDHLYLVLESPGGDPFSAVAIMNILQNRFKQISAVVPKNATSAATLMALGTDKIYMHDRAYLGPLDLPIEHPVDGSRISALDVQQTITTISSLAESIANERYFFLRDPENRKVSKKDAAEMALNYSNKLVEPIVKQIDPYHLQKANRELRIGYYYAVDMLASRMMKGSIDQTFKTARALVNDFPTHEYAIFPEETKGSLRLVIDKLEELNDWKNHLQREYETKVIGKRNVISYTEIETKDHAGKK